MKIKLLLSALILAATTAVAAPQPDKVSVKDTITDTHIVFPSSFDTDVNMLKNNWYMQRYAVLDSVAKRKSTAAPSDEVYKNRLQRLPNVIEMPFNSIVKAYIEMYANRKPELVEQMLGRSLYYMPIFEEALEKYQLPCELKYLPIIESALEPNAVSKAGACGLWQFMSNTAMGEGLEVNSLVDQRRDPIASSEAAAHYLLTLYNIYQDWPLAIAAYNCGPGNVNKAIKRAGDVKDYWVIYPFLPEETRGYVPAFIAANYIMNYYAEHGISHALARRPLVTDTVHVNQRVHFQQIAEVMGLPIDEIRTLNPQYRQDIIPGNIRPYTLILPSVQAYCFVANQDTIVNHNRQLYFAREVVEPADGRVRTDGNGGYVDQLVVKQHKVQRGETLKSIAQKYGVTAQSIREANNLKSSKIKVGKVLKINTYQRQYNGNGSAQSDELLADNGSQQQQEVAAAMTKAKNNAASQKSAGNAKTNTKAKQGNGKAQGTKTQNAAKSQQSGVTHVVKSGENLDKIARKYGVTVDALKKANNLKSNTIHPKDKLKVPQKK